MRDKKLVPRVLCYLLLAIVLEMTAISSVARDSPSENFTGLWLFGTLDGTVWLVLRIVSARSERDSARFGQAHQHDSAGAGFERVHARVLPAGALGPAGHRRARPVLQGREEDQARTRQARDDGQGARLPQR